MDLRQLGYVVAVVDHGGFTKAARALHVAQPSLSQAVKALETELGVELFVRSGRSAVLTPAGEALVEPARRALRDAATAREAVADIVGLLSGRLDVVCLPTLSVHPAAELVGRFRRRHPGVVVRVVEPADVDAAVRMVRDGTAEVGFVDLPVPESGLVTHPLSDHDFVAVVAAEVADELGSARRVPVRMLARLPLIATPPGTSTRRVIDDAFAAAGVEAHVAVETDHRESIGALVAAGAGMSLLPRPLAEDARRQGAVIRDVSPRIRRAVGLIYRDGPLGPAGRAFVALVDPPAGRRHRAARP